ncbi:MAG: hypothetical protein M1120_00665 [Patescibacteria group bacterium]|nr:hypothetical protein [Patescibacteria group bacterium]
MHAAYDVRTPWESHAGNHIKRTLDRLRKRKLVKFKEKGDKVIIELTDLGKKEIIRFDINKMEIARSKKWDGRWWMVIFDIPEKYKKRRNIFQRKLKELGFYFIQKSVCLHPFSCKKETDFLREFYGIKKWVNLLRVDYFEEEYKAKLKFNLK